MGFIRVCYDNQSICEPLHFRRAENWPFHPIGHRVRHGTLARAHHDRIRADVFSRSSPQPRCGVRRAPPRIETGNGAAQHVTASGPPPPLAELGDSSTITALYRRRTSSCGMRCHPTVDKPILRTPLGDPKGRRSQTAEPCAPSRVVALYPLSDLCLSLRPRTASESLRCP